MDPTSGSGLDGVLVGHDTDPRRPTGVTVVLLPDGTTVGVDVRGAAPGTRETDLLDPVNTIDVAHAIVLAGGSAYGLAAASGVMQWLEEHGRGVEVGPVRVPIVPAAVVFDLLVGDPTIRPDGASGYRACAAAVPLASAGRGSIGAGAGATVGKLLGPDRAMRGGVGVSTLSAGGLTMAAVVVVNAVGDVVDPTDGGVLAGARRSAESLDPVGTVEAILAMAGAPTGAPASGSTSDAGAGAGGATTIGAIVTDARLSKAQATRLAQVAHDGLARTIRPVHTPMDGDTLFVAGTGAADGVLTEMTLLSIMAAEVTATAVLDAVRSAEGLRLEGLHVPAWADRPLAG
jgi:L-aminopeptidase/D-esterase-like protein